MLTDEVFEWNVTNDRIEKKAPMLVPNMDFGACYTEGYIYCAGGWANVELFLFQQKSLRYNVAEDTWQYLPDLVGNGKCTLCSVKN